MTKSATTEANEFLRVTALKVMEEPAFASRAASALLDPVENAQLAAEVAARALTQARTALPASKASIAFDALCVSDRAALADSVEIAFGTEAAAALRSDPMAYAMIPERSSALLSAWRFSDDSFILCSRSADQSLPDFGKALLSCPAFIALLAPHKNQSISRALRLANSLDNAVSLSKNALSSLLMSMRDGSGWKRGTRILTVNGMSLLSPDTLLALLEAPEIHMNLDQIIAEVLSRASKT